MCGSRIFLSVRGPHPSDKVLTYLTQLILQRGSNLLLEGVGILTRNIPTETYIVTCDFPGMGVQPHPLSGFAHGCMLCLPFFTTSADKILSKVLETNNIFISDC